MKTLLRKALYIAAAILTASSVSGCIPGMIVDWAPVVIQIRAFDKDGNNLCDPDFEGNWIDGTTITIGGDTYPVVKSWEMDNHPATKAYLPVSYGFVCYKWKDYNSGEEEYRFKYGEIDGAQNMDLDFTITWKDGSQDVISYKCSRHREVPTPSCKRSWKLNGEKNSSGLFTFIKG